MVARLTMKPRADGSSHHPADPAGQSEERYELSVNPGKRNYEVELYVQIKTDFTS